MDPQTKIIWIIGLLGAWYLTRKKKKPEAPEDDYNEDDDEEKSKRVHKPVQLNNQKQGIMEKLFHRR